MSDRVLVRYGTISEVANFEIPSDFVRNRGERVVVRTHRGIELGTLLTDEENASKRPAAGNDSDANGRDPGDRDLNQQSILRTATAMDEQAAARLRSECEQGFGDWRERIEKWNLCLELIDLEWTLDKSKLILYVLNDRGPESTKLALTSRGGRLRHRGSANRGTGRPDCAKFRRWLRKRPLRFGRFARLLRLDQRKCLKTLSLRSKRLARSSGPSAAIEELLRIARKPGRAPPSLRCVASQKEVRDGPSPLAARRPSTTCPKNGKASSKRPTSRPPAASERLS